MSASAEHADRDLISEVLTGALTEDTLPRMFDDDSVLFAVRRLETADPDWLLAQLGDRRLPLDGRIQVAGDTGTLRDRAAAILRPEKPDLLL